MADKLTDELTDGVIMQNELALAKVRMVTARAEATQARVSALTSVAGAARVIVETSMRIMSYKDAVTTERMNSADTVIGKAVSVMSLCTEKLAAINKSI